MRPYRATSRCTTTDAQAVRPYRATSRCTTTDAQIVRPYKGRHVSSFGDGRTDRASLQPLHVGWFGDGRSTESPYNRYTSTEEIEKRHGANENSPRRGEIKLRKNEMKVRKNEMKLRKNEMKVRKNFPVSHWIIEALHGGIARSPPASDFPP